jgi:hypothetical protein
MSGVLSKPRKKLAILLAAVFAAMMLLSAGPAVGTAEAMGKHHWKKPVKHQPVKHHWWWKLQPCAYAKAGGALAVACPHHATAKAGDTKARAE